MAGTRDPAPSVDVVSIPKTRGDCADGPRPCPHVTCKHHIHTDIGTLLPAGESCTLDVADRGGVSLDEVADILHFASRESVRLIEARALNKAKRSKSKAMAALREHVEDGVLEPTNRHLAKHGGHRDIELVPDAEAEAEQDASEIPSDPMCEHVWTAYLRASIAHGHEKRRVECEEPQVMFAFLLGATG